MQECSDNLEFEKASLIKNKLAILKSYFSYHNNLPVSLNENDIIILVPSSAREKTIELFMIKSGRIVHQEIIGRKAPLNKINNLLIETYFNGYTTPLFYTSEELDEIRILRTWINRKQDYVSIINIYGKSKKSIFQELQSKIRNINIY
jgi:excinuclease UvrABC nuclease subunit